ncbi:MAG: hypothetical protein JNM09_15310 [Blastocatellia bacterium]|nr:hypothetical protein [Blastocatellia bacterium]
MRNAKWLVALLILALFGTVTFAQSGRKQKKAPDLPPVQGVPAPSKTPETPQPDIPEPDPEKEKEKEKERASAKGIILGTDWADMNVSMGMADYVRRACHSELSRVIRGLEIRNTGSMSRSDAIKMAKDEDRFYVVAIEFQSFGSQYEVRYTVFEPKTAKAIGIGSAPIYTDSTGRVSYYSFERAGRDIAQQLIRRLDLRSSRFP